MANRYERQCGYAFNRLSEGVKKKLLDKKREHCADYQWWDSTYEDAKNMGALIGIDIDEINFTGFYSQGDGACFAGRYSHKPDAVEAITQACGGKDAVLIRIASDLTVLQTTWKLLHGFTFECTIHTTGNGNYSHSGTMQTGYPDDEDQYQVEGVEDMDLRVQDQMRAFADWIYRQLESEYEHLTSDEACIESLIESGLRFSSSGDIL